jgi:DNA (cytosine-5)-methyltransferase 1
MGVPQKRERCFFIAQRKDQGFPKLKLQFDEKPILFGAVRSEHGKPYNGVYNKELAMYKHGDKNISDIKERNNKKSSGFNHTICADDEVHATVPSSGFAFRAYDKMLLSDDDCKSVSTFPQDYDFGDQIPKYITGMSVPPVMMAQVATEVYNQWLKQ